MGIHEVQTKPLLAWLFCAMSAPMVQLLADTDWRLTLLTGLSVTFVVCLSLSCGKVRGRAVWVAQWLWLAVVLSQWAAASEVSWPMSQNGEAVSLILLGLSAWAAGKNVKSTVAMGGILLILLLLGYGGVFASAVPQVRWDWASLGVRDYWTPLGVFLLPAAAALIPAEKTKKGCLWLLFLPVVGALAALVTCGTVAVDSREGSYGFYQMVRSLSLFGIAERFEALACSLITVGWFSVMTLLLSCGGIALEKVAKGKYMLGVWSTALIAGAGLLCKIHIQPSVFVAGSVIFWVLTPLLTQVVGFWKKVEKR